MTRARRRLISCTLLVALHLNLLAKDPYLWLEEIEGEKALSWVRKQNEVSQKAIEGFPFFKEIHDQTLRILQSDDRIPYFSRRGRQLYNFWQDKEHTRGIWRRTTLNEYKKDKTGK